MLVWAASLILAMKYQLVASSMEHYITGNLGTIKNMRLTQTFFISLLVLLIGSCGYYISVCFNVKEQGKNLAKV